MIGDRIVAGTYLAALAATRGSGVILGVDPNTLPMEIKKFIEIGIDITIQEKSLNIESTDKYESIELSTLPFPGVATDLQPIF